MPATYTCQRCGSVNPRSSGRGRPRTFCPSCSKIRHDQSRVVHRYVNVIVGWKHNEQSLDEAIRQTDGDEYTLADETYDPSGGQRTSWPTSETSERTHAKVTTQILPYPGRPGLSLHLTYHRAKAVIVDVEAGQIRTPDGDGLNVVVTADDPTKHPNEEYLNAEIRGGYLYDFLNERLELLRQYSEMSMERDGTDGQEPYWDTSVNGPRPVLRSQKWQAEATEAERLLAEQRQRIAAQVGRVLS